MNPRRPASLPLLLCLLALLAQSLLPAFAAQPPSAGGGLAALICGGHAGPALLDELRDSLPAEIAAAFDDDTRQPASSTCDLCCGMTPSAPPPALQARLQQAAERHDRARAAHSAPTTARPALRPPLRGPPRIFV